MAEDNCVVLLLSLSNRVRMNDNGRALMEPHQDKKILVQYTRRLDLSVMGGDRAALSWIATSANIWDMEVLEMADEHVSVMTRFGFMDENGGSNSEMFKAIADMLNLCHEARSRDWDVVEARRSGVEVEANPPAKEGETVEGEVAQS